MTRNGESLSAEVGRRLRERRLQLDLPIRRVAEDAAVSVGHLSEIENGHSFASLPVLLRVSRVLRYPLGDLLPKIGGHRVRQDTLGSTGAKTRVLSHPDLALSVRSIRLDASGSCTERLEPRTSALLYVVAGECSIEVGRDRHVLAAGDAADVVHASEVIVVALTPTVALLVQGPAS